MSTREGLGKLDITEAMRSGLAEYAKLAEMDRLVASVFETFKGSVLAVSAGEFTAIESEGSWLIVATGFITEEWGQRARQLIGPSGRWASMEQLWASVGVPFAYVKRGAFGRMEFTGAWAYHAGGPTSFSNEVQLLDALVPTLKITMLGACFTAARQRWNEEVSRPAPIEEGGFCSTPVEAETSFGPACDRGPVVRFENLRTHEAMGDFKRRYVRCCR